jgi:hypothetical protein
MPSVLELYEKLKPKLGEQETRSLLEYVESTVERRAATKADLERNTGELREEIRRREGELREEIRRVEGELREEIRRVEGALREEMHSMRADLFKEMHSMKADLIKWSFVFWMGAVVALSGVAFTLLRLFGPR